MLLTCLLTSVQNRRISLLPTLQKNNKKAPKTRVFSAFLLKKLVDDTGLEPVTSRTSSGCSYQLS